MAIMLDESPGGTRLESSVSPRLADIGNGAGSLAVVVNGSQSSSPTVHTQTEVKLQGVSVIAPNCACTLQEIKLQGVLT